MWYIVMSILETTLFTNHKGARGGGHKSINWTIHQHRKKIFFSIKVTIENMEMKTTNCKETAVTYVSYIHVTKGLCKIYKEILQIIKIK